MTPLPPPTTRTAQRFPRGAGWHRARWHVLAAVICVAAGMALGLPAGSYQNANRSGALGVLAGLLVLAGLVLTYRAITKAGQR